MGSGARRPRKSDGKALSIRLWRYALSPATENWARHVREAHGSRPARAVGFVGATSAGKSWLVGCIGSARAGEVSKLQSDGAAQPARFEQSFVGGARRTRMLDSVCRRRGLAIHDVGHQPLHGPGGLLSSLERPLRSTISTTLTLRGAKQS